MRLCDKLSIIQKKGRLGGGCFGSLDELCQVWPTIEHFVSDKMTA